MKMVLILTMMAFATMAWGQSDGGSGVPAAASGLLQFAPPQPLECVAVRVDVPEDKMLTGVTWFNGSSQAGNLRLLVASGSDAFPPAYGEAVTVADSVVGQDQSWSTVAFTAPVASESGTLFVLVEYPPGYAPPTVGPAPGIGYADQESPYAHFLTGDGLNWVRVANRCRVLLEPILSDRQAGAVAMRQGAAAGSPPAAERLGLYISPNPFNPQTQVDLYLKAATTGTVRVLDVRGRQVAELHRGALVAGRNTLTWAGRDGSGRPVASGVYWVLAETDQEHLVKKMLLVK